MKKKLAAVILAGCMIMTTACTKEVQQTPASTVEAEEIFSEAEASQEQTQTQETETQQTQAQQTEEQTSTTETENTTEAQSPSYEHPNEAAGLTEGEKEARKQQQANFAEARDCYSVCQTQRIRQQKSIRWIDRFWRIMHTTLREPILFSLETALQKV